MPQNKRLTPVEREIITAWRQEKAAGVLRVMGQIYPPPRWALEGAERRANDELEIDDHPLRSETDDGCWVSAWVYIEMPAGLEDDDAE